MTTRPLADRKPRKSSRESGQTLILVVASLAAICGFFGLAIDVGYLQTVRRQAQIAADGAAMAGAQEVMLSSTLAVIKAAAQDSSTQNGFQNSVNGVTVTVNNPPLSGPNTGVASAVEVIVSKTTPTFFMGMLGTPTLSISARAVGVLSPSPFCIQTTGPVGEGIDIDGGFVLNAPTCGIQVNSVCTTSGSGGCGDQAITTHGGDCKGNPGTGTNMVVTSAISIVAPSFNQGVCTSPQPNFGALPVADMLGYLPQPSPGTCASYPGHKYTTNTALSPGTYCGGIWVTNNAKVTMSAGTYVLYGGSTMTNVGGTAFHSLVVDGGASLTGSGVTIFNYGTASPYKVNTPPAGDWGSMVLCTATGPNPSCAKSPGPTGTAEATVTLSAPTTGTYAGILMFDARTLPNSNAQFGSTDQFMPCGGSNTVHEDCAKMANNMQSFTGGDNQSLDGTMYFPSTQLNFTGSTTSSTSTCSPFVGWILLWNTDAKFPTGGLTIKADCSSVTGGNPLKAPGLGE